MTKGMSQTETTGPALAENLGWESDLGRASCRAELVHAFGLGHEPYSLCCLSLTLSISNKYMSNKKKHEAKCQERLTKNDNKKTEKAKEEDMNVECSWQKKGQYQEFHSRSEPT
ncbi:hypothetical protein GQ457_17G005220 [Hibiscus cannabinus]